MIKINLLAEGKRALAKRPKPVAAPAIENLGQWALLGLLALGLLVGLAHYLLLRNTIQNKDEEIAVAQKEVEELAPIIKEVEEYKAKKTELEHKIQIINDLKANQRGPVRIMDRVSQALPELLWLDRVDVTANAITINGQAFNTNAVANFIENLDKVSEFQEPILRDTSQRGPIYTFAISFNYSFTSPVGEEAEAATQATGG